MEQFVEKVTAFVLRERDEGRELLLFRHPYAGNQIPAGTVEMGEAPEAAALRETAEETGLTDVQIVDYMGYEDETPVIGDHIIYRSTTVYARPDPTSFDWAHLRRGIEVRVERESGDFRQVTYIEYDRFPDPRYASMQITGWVHLDCLAQGIRRHFYRLAFIGDAPDSWEHFADNHMFRLFWARLDALPDIIAPQIPWIERLRRAN